MSKIKDTEAFSELISEKAIRKRVEELAEEINNEFSGQEVVVITVLKGAAPFAADLVRCLDFPVITEYMILQSYHLTESTGKVDLVRDMSTDLAGKNVLVIEDIVDTGTTIQYIYNHLDAKKPNKLKLCVLLDNPARRVHENVSADFVGFIIPDKFVIGYGLDYNQLYRNLPFIATLNMEVN